MSKINITGTIFEIKNKTYPSGSCLSTVKIASKLFDGSIHYTAIKFFNNRVKNLADIIKNKCRIGDSINAKVYVKPWEFTNDDYKICKVVQFIAEDFIKIEKDRNCPELSEIM